MSPPIRDGSGNDIGSIRLGDGSEISEARTGAGDVLFSGNAIPDKQDLYVRYDFRQEDGTTPVTDQSGNGRDLDTGSYTGVGRSINGNQAGNFDGDIIEGDFSTNISAPWTIFAVGEFDDTSPQSYITSKKDVNLGNGIGCNNDHWQIAYAGNFSRSNNNSTNLNPNDFTFYAAPSGGTATLSVNGTQVESVGGADETLGSMVLGDRGTTGAPLDGAIGAVLVYNGDKRSIESQVRNYFAKEWGL